MLSDLGQRQFGNSQLFILKRTFLSGGSKEMRLKLVKAFIVGGISVSATTIVFAQQSSPAPHFDRGKYEYEAHCAVCHGPSGAGDGPYSGFLTKTIPNLRTLSKMNGGVFPFARVYETIDGSQAVPAHGTRDMPIWGPRYNIAGRESDEFRPDIEAFVRTRILALTEYVYRLQGK